MDMKKFPAYITAETSAALLAQSKARRAHFLKNGVPHVDMRQRADDRETQPGEFPTGRRAGDPTPTAYDSSKPVTVVAEDGTVIIRPRSDLGRFAAQPESVEAFVVLAAVKGHTK